VNLNAAETTGIDADITLLIGVERLRINGAGGSDNISGAGGAGTGDPFTLPMELTGTSGDDILKGGTAGDQLQGGFDDDTLAGGGGSDSLNGGDDADTLKGGGGPDFLHATDGVSGNDEVFGGKGADTCDADVGDTVTSC
jgi:Ca2+-binding RTX toxin-like protein